jgi:hypothetical protein
MAAHQKFSITSFLHHASHDEVWIGSEVGGVDMKSADFIHLMIRNDYCSLTWTSFSSVRMYDLESSSTDLGYFWNVGFRLSRSSSSESFAKYDL